MTPAVLRYSAFTTDPSGGNPAGVVLDARGLSDAAMQRIAGLATPLLDWTESPFAALYFAFDKEQAPATDRRAIWALGGVSLKNKEITSSHKGPDSPPILELIRPLQDENSRLVSQSGLFTKTPYGHTVESWVKEYFKDDGKYMTLIKIIIPNRDRPDCLKMLNKMNINHASLFPDLYGAGAHCNKRLQIDGY
ncbi:FRG domain-containing protein [Pseudoxanthomonas sp. F11]|uniref:PhzF family phenazine biosynthesis protein n=1 Tax=Pseudoxanthomonas sp. F11 TaxID=3126308 RepID=UPI00300CF29D